MDLAIKTRAKYISLQSKVRRLLNPGINQEQFERQESDYLICSLPCCGRTWLRVMLGHVLQKISRFELSHCNPQSLFYLHQLDSDLPSIKATHELFSDAESYSDKNVILLTRDPRSALFSRTRKKIKRRSDLKQEDFRDVFRDLKYLKKMIKFYNDWAENQACAKSFMMLRYEDLVENNYQELCRILEFMQISSSKEIIDFAIANSTFDSMSKFDTRKFKFGSGKPKEFKSHLDQDDLAWSEQYILDSLNPKYGYNYRA